MLLAAPQRKAHAGPGSPSFLKVAPWLGMSVPFTYISQLFVRVDSPGRLSSFIATPYPCFIAVCVLVALFSSSIARQSPAPRRRAFLVCDVLSALVMMASAVMMLVGAGGSSAGMLIWGMELGGAAVAWMYVHWGVLYARIPLRESVGAICGSIALSGMLKAALALSSPVATAVIELALAPVGVLLLHWCGRSASSAAGSPKATADDQAPLRVFEDLWVLPIFLVLFCAAIGFFYGAGGRGGRDVSMLVIEASYLTEVLAALAVLWWVCVRRRSVSLVGICAALAVIVATGAFALSLLSDRVDFFFRLCANIDHSLLTLFLWMTLDEISCRVRRSPLAVYSVGWALRSTPFWLGFSIADVTGAGATPAACASVVYLMVVMLALVIAGNNASVKGLFGELRGKARVEAGTLEERCGRLASRYGLTQREEQVLAMLSRGYTRPHIAETLGISENTVRGYSKSIYSKLNIHDRMSLFSLVESSTPVSGGQPGDTATPDRAVAGSPARP